MFDVKDPFPRGLCVGVVYKILCVGCHVYYVGETTWHFSALVCQHMLSDRASCTYKILSNAALHTLMTVSVFYPTCNGQVVLIRSFKGML